MNPWFPIGSRWSLIAIRWNQTGPNFHPTRFELALPGWQTEPNPEQ